MHGSGPANRCLEDKFRDPVLRTLAAGWDCPDSSATPCGRRTDHASRGGGSITRRRPDIDQESSRGRNGASRSHSSGTDHNEGMYSENNDDSEWKAPSFISGLIARSNWSNRESTRVRPFPVPWSVPAQSMMTVTRSQQRRYAYVRDT